jgi:hypothetical protein
MTLHSALAFSALAASVLLFVTAGGRILPTIALVASGLEVLMTLGILRIAIAQLPLGLVLGLLLGLPGLVAWFRASSKPAVSAAAIVAFIGVLQVAVYAGVRGA